MTINVTGKVQKSPMGIGAWMLVGDDGQTYELYNPPADLTATEDKVKIKGKIREDVMTIAMIGPVLEVDSFELSR